MRQQVVSTVKADPEKAGRAGSKLVAGKRSFVTPAAPTSWSKPRKAAMLMVLLGEEAARKICEHLPPEALRVLAQEIASLGPIPPDTAAEVLQEYQRLNSGGQEPLARGGPDFATQFLVKTLGADQSRPLLEQVRSVSTTRKNFAAVEKPSGKNSSSSAARTSSNSCPCISPSERARCQKQCFSCSKSPCGRKP